MMPFTLGSPRLVRRLNMFLGQVALFGLLLATSSGTAHAQAKQLIVRGSLQHIHGVNLPWINNTGSSYGHDIGPNHYTGYGYDYVGGDIDRYFTDIKNMHTNVVRIWLFENMEGLNFATDGSISGIDSTFLANLTDLVQRANNHGLALELTLFTFDVGSQFGHVPNNGGGGALKNFFTDSGAQSALINNVVKPLATKFTGNWGVYGYDLMNESNYAVTSGTGTWAQMHSYIYNLTSAIHGVNSSIQVTCSTDDVSSFSSNNHWNRYGGVGLNYYDYHQYSDSPNLFALGSNGPYPSIDKPIVLAEYGPRTTGNWSLQNTVTDAFVNQASNQGWAGSLAWDYDPSGADNLSLISGVGNWHNASWTIQWYGQNKFGL